jgi:hypothetical protein
MLETKFHTHTHRKHRKKNGGLNEHTRTTIASHHSHSGSYRCQNLGQANIGVAYTKRPHYGKSWFISKMSALVLFSSFLIGNNHVSATKPNQLMLFIVRTIWNTQIHCVEKLWDLLMLQQEVHIVSTVL